MTTQNSAFDSPIAEPDAPEKNNSDRGNNFSDTPPHHEDGSLSRLQAETSGGGSERVEVEGFSSQTNQASAHPASEARHPPPRQAGEGRKKQNNQPRRDKRDVHGWVVLDKPVGMTSTHAVAVVKRLFSAKRAGHAGTLDPLASGGLPIALGEATKTVPFVMDGRKRYRFTVQWGEERDTDDTEGRVTATSESRPAADAVRALLPRFTGVIEQIPPQYSAIKIQGERAYDLARDGETVALQPRPVEIHHFTLVEHTDDGRSLFEAECGKGTYVRALARDIGRILGCYGHISALRRTLVGPFDEADMIPLEELEALCNRAASGEGSLADALLPVETALDDIPALAVTRADAARLHRGQAVLLRGRDAPQSSGTVYVTVAGRLLALAELGHGELIPKRVFNLTGLTASSGRNERA
ncbi:tRNA pseudouridine synthase B [Nitrobacter hamburgensis X14]|uniref:tRNA pseudouridine synthase B n=1 Tax=Nitrobacter hamburgensis (strain DSM 10229 / NCIMB 13809 / X14) TaxID=323097 RepID=Q1QS62_NITHX|nr:tRNA pseudouridine synthase B [Nitrobacter hamburgensis X14]